MKTIFTFPPTNAEAFQNEKVTCEVNRHAKKAGDDNCCSKK